MRLARKTDAAGVAPRAVGAMRLGGALPSPAALVSDLKIYGAAVNVGAAHERYNGDHGGWQTEIHYTGDPAGILNIRNYCAASKLRYENYIASAPAEITVIFDDQIGINIDTNPASKSGEWTVPHPWNEETLALYQAPLFYNKNTQTSGDYAKIQQVEDCFETRQINGAAKQLKDLQTYDFSANFHGGPLLNTYRDKRVLGIDRWILRTPNLVNTIRQASYGQEQASRAQVGCQFTVAALGVNSKKYHLGDLSAYVFVKLPPCIDVVKGKTIIVQTYQGVPVFPGADKDLYPQGG